MKATASLLLLLALGAPAVHANEPSAAASASPTAAASVTQGEVRRIDLDNQKVTLRHGPIANLGMPGMTMVFHVSDPSVLNQLKPGDKVRFTADRVNGMLEVTHLERVD